MATSGTRMTLAPRLASSSSRMSSCLLSGTATTCPRKAVDVSGSSIKSVTKRNNYRETKRIFVTINNLKYQLLPIYPHVLRYAPLQSSKQVTLQPTLESGVSNERTFCKCTSRNDFCHCLCSLCRCAFAHNAWRCVIPAGLTAIDHQNTGVTHMRTRQDSGTCTTLPL